MLVSTVFCCVDYVERVFSKCHELPRSWLRSWLTHGDYDCDCDRVLWTAIVTAHVTGSLVTAIAIAIAIPSLFCDCVQVATSIVTLTRMVTVARSRRIFFLTMIIMTPRLAHDGHNRDQFFSNPGGEATFIDWGSIFLESLWFILEGCGRIFKKCWKERK